MGKGFRSNVQGEHDSGRVSLRPQTLIYLSSLPEFSPLRVTGKCHLLTEEAFTKCNPEPGTKSRDSSV